MFILKIPFAPLSLILSLFVWLCAGLLSCSGFVFKLASGLLSLLAFAVLKGIVDARTAFDLSVLEETYQNMYWHEDAEAARAREKKREAAIFYAKLLCKTGEMK